MSGAVDGSTDGADAADAAAGESGRAAGGAIVARVWRAVIEVPAAIAEAAEALIAELTEPASIAIGDLAEGALAAPGHIRIEALWPTPPDESALLLALAAAGAGPGALLSLEPLPETDWVAAVLRTLHPVSAGRFRLHGGHDPADVGDNRIALRIDAGLAFGTGHHGTTRGCLLAIDRLARWRRFRRALDLGTGTGALAIAAAKLWPLRAVATDIDPVAVAVARANAALNGVGPRIRTAIANGARSDVVRHAGPYDLIFANILARPVQRLAAELCAQLAPGGVCVLSGLLDAQAARVRARYRARGLVMLDHIHVEGWSTLVMTRP